MWTSSDLPDAVDPQAEQEQVSLLTLLDELGLTRLATGDAKSGSALQPESGGNRGDAGIHAFPCRCRFSLLTLLARVEIRLP